MTLMIPLREGPGSVCVDSMEYLTGPLNKTQLWQVKKSDLKTVY